MTRAAVLALFLAAVPVHARENAPIVVIPEADRPRVTEEIRTALARYDSTSAFPLPQLEEERLGELLGGEVVRFREKWVLSHEGEDDEQTRQRVLAYRLVRAPRKVVWLSALDPHFLLNDSLTEIRIEDKPRGSSTWYQYMDLPWPVKNRHWIIHLAKGIDVCEATGGQAWEQNWRLESSGESMTRELDLAGRLKPMDSGKVRGARYLDANDGAWAMFVLEDDLTLLTYNLTIVMGGWIPEGLASRFAMRALEDLLDRVAKNAETIPTHYVEGHETMIAGDGTPIPFFPTPATDGSKEP